MLNNRSRQLYLKLGLKPWEECVRKYFCEEINILLAANKMKYDIPIKDKLKEILNGVLNYF